MAKKPPKEEKVIPHTMPIPLSPQGTEFLSFFNELFSDHPLFPECRGAKEEDIQALLAYADRPLPAIYLEYLRTLGGNDGPLNLGSSNRSSAKAVLASYQRHGEDWRDYHPANGFRFTTDDAGQAHSLVYEDGVSEPHVAISDLNHIVSVIAERFDIHLFRMAWERRWFTARANPSTPGRNIRIAGATSLDGVRRAAQEQVFNELWFSDHLKFCGEKGSVRVTTLFSSVDLYIYFTSDDPTATTRECAAFREALESVVAD